MTTPYDEGIHVKMNTNKRPTWMLALLACALLLAGVAAGCKSASNTATPTAAPAEKKAMLESVAKWYVAQGALDMKGFKDGVYDPQNILGVATMTAAPEGAQKSDVKWSWVGRQHRPHAFPPSRRR